MGSTSIDDINLVKGSKYNLLSISQFCDKWFKVIFESSYCIVQNERKWWNMLAEKQLDNVYVISLENISSSFIKCSVTLKDKGWLWHRRLDHVNMHLISNLFKMILLLVFQRSIMKKNHLYNTCQQDKQVKFSFRPNNVVSIIRPLELLHMDLFELIRTLSFGGKRHGLIIVDNYFKYT